MPANIFDLISSDIVTLRDDLWNQFHYATLSGRHSNKLLLVGLLRGRAYIHSDLLDAELKRMTAGG